MIQTPDPMDAFISSMSDPETSSVLAYERYIERVRSDSWGDHVVISALANMFHVTINVVHARQRDCTVSITPPVDSQSNCELNLGLVMQYHFVGLDKQEIVVPHDNENPNIINQKTTPNDQFVSNDHSNDQSTSNLYNLDPEQISVSHGTEISVRVYSCDQQSNANDQPTSQSNFDVSDQPSISSSNFDTIDQTATPLDDSAIRECDEHTRQITGGPLASIMSIENPNEIVCVAPAEGQRPLSIMTDSIFETMSDPEKFPISDGCFAAERPRKLTYRKYFNQRFLDVDGRFAKDIDYLFVAQYIIEVKQIVDDANIFIWRQKPGRDFTAQQAKDKSIVGQCLRKDKAYKFMKNVFLRHITRRHTMNC